MAGTPVPISRDPDSIVAIENRKRDLVERIRRDISRADPDSTRNQLRQWVVFGALIALGVTVLYLAAQRWRDVAEPRRVCRRLPPVRGWEHDEDEAGAVPG